MDGRMNVLQVEAKETAGIKTQEQAQNSQNKIDNNHIDTIFGNCILIGTINWYNYQKLKKNKTKNNK